jgi:2'-5' RNA ligase
LVRCFICIEIENDETIKQISQILEKIKSIEGIRPVKHNQLHITLKFLGEVASQQLAEIIRQLEEVSFNSFHLNFDRFGVFPHTKKPRVIWLGVSEGYTQLTDLAQIIETRLVPIGYSREKRKFSPHLTLGRVKRLTPSGKGQIEELLIQEDFIPNTKEFINTLYFKKSTLTPKGAIYENLAEIALQ